MRFLFVIFIGIAVVTSAQTPQNFLQPKIWLRADKFNSNLGYWQDLSGNDNNAFPADSFQPATDGLINFNRAITFDGDNDKFTIPLNMNDANQFTVISVYHSKGTISERGIWHALIGKNQELMLSTQRAKGPQTIVKYSEGNMNFPVVNITSQYWGKSSSGVTSTNRIEIGAGNLGESDNDAFSGSVAEFIVFDRLASGAELQILQSYLSIKYGVPLIYTDYLTSKGSVIWNYEGYRDFPFSITGIGRDDDMLLYQKQSSCTSEPDFLTIGAGEIAESNDANTSVLGKNDFLLWGDNGKELKVEKVLEEKYPYKLPVLERKWLMSVVGNSASKLSTQIKLNVKELLNDPPKCYLIIDRSGLGDFSAQSIEYIQASRIDETGYAYFDNIKWDVDNSGTDIFTFSFGMDNGVISNDPSCFNESTGSVNIDVQGGIPPYSFTLKNDSLQFEKKWLSKSRKHFIDNLSSGKYKLAVTDSVNDAANNTIKINDGKKFSLGLNDKYALQLGKWVDFDFETNTNYSGAKFVWESSNGFYSTLNKVRIFDPGTYTVSVTNSSGCSVKENFTVLVSGKVFYTYQLNPNPSNGDYKITIALAEKSDITIRIFNTQGILLNEKVIPQTSRCETDGYLQQPGIYFIEIGTKLGKEVFKFIVN